MADQFTYSILQYQHSLLLNESVNVGIVFSFPGESKIYFVPGNLNRVKCLYPDFDPSLFNTIVKGIKTKLIPNADSLFDTNNQNTFKQQLNALLIPDSSALQFSDPFVSVDTFNDIEKTIDAFSKMILPGNQPEKEDEFIHNEQYILRRFTESIERRNIPVNTRLGRNRKLETKGFTLSFDYAWRNGVTHLIKPVSFDLTSARFIQDKAILHVGYLDAFGGYADRNGYVFDYLIAKPTNPQLFKVYDSALEILSEAKAPKEIVPEERIEEYSERTAEILRTHGLDEEPGEEAS
jgi:hypothetical protein